MANGADVITSDAKILDSTFKTYKPTTNTNELEFPGRFMPDGKPFMGSVPEKIDGSIRREWCEAVRREWNARNNSEEIKEVSPANPPESGGVGTTPDAGVPDGGVRPSGPDLSGWKETLVADLKAKISSQRGLVEADKQQLKFLSDKMVETAGKIEEAQLRLLQMESTLEVLEDDQYE